MTSPLELFRKKQKVLMVPLTILAMFAFIVMDQLKPEQFPPIMGMLIFGFLFWYLGKDRGKGKLFAVIGTVIGFFLGYAYMPRIGAETVVSSTVGNIDEMEYQKLVQNRQIANQFVSRSYFASLTEEELERARVPRGALFGFGRNNEDDIILEYLFRKEAEKMNLVVSDDAISQYISRYTNNKLSPETFQEVCQQMRISPGKIYDILRDQLKARLVFQLNLPKVSLTPDQYWNFYRKFNVREELELVALPVKDFENEVSAPTDTQKKAFYETYKGIFRNEKGPGTPGLRQPQKVMTEYLMADYEEAEKQVAEVTDAEIKAFYEVNKERLYKNHPIPDSPDMNAPSDPASPTVDQPIEAVKPGSRTPNPKTGPALPSTPTKETTPKQATDKKPVEKKPAEKKKTTEKKEESSALDADTTTFVSLLDEKSTENPVVAPKPGGVTIDSKKSTSTTAPPPMQPYRVLDEDLKDEIRDQLLRERSLSLMQEQISGAITFMNSLSDRIRDPLEGTTPPTAKEATAELKAYAAKHKLIYNITPMMTYQELQESEKYPLGMAKEPTLNEFNSQPRTVLEQLFGTGPNLLFMPYEAEDSFSSALLAYWKVKHIDAVIPKYTDPGIDELIVEQMNIENARPIALKRAEELKKLIVDAGDKGMQEAVKGQTISGKKDGEELSTQTTEAFSWMHTSTAGASNPFSMPEPKLSTISAIDGAGNDFMEQVFDNMENGEVGIVMNVDKSIYYVVKVVNRIPSTPGGLTAMYQEFLKTDLFFFFSPYLPLAQNTQQQAIYDWSQDIMAKYEVQKSFPQEEQREETPE